MMCPPLPTLLRRRSSRAASREEPATPASAEAADALIFLAQQTSLLSDPMCAPRDSEDRLAEQLFSCHLPLAGRQVADRLFAAPDVASPAWTMSLLLRASRGQDLAVLEGSLRYLSAVRPRDPDTLGPLTVRELRKALSSCRQRIRLNRALGVAEFGCRVFRGLVGLLLLACAHPGGWAYYLQNLVSISLLRFAGGGAPTPFQVTAVGIFLAQYALAPQPAAGPRPLKSRGLGPREDVVGRRWDQLQGLMGSLRRAVGPRIADELSFGPYPAEGSPKEAGEGRTLLRDVGGLGVVGYCKVVGRAAFGQEDLRLLTHMLKRRNKVPEQVRQRWELFVEKQLHPYQAGPLPEPRPDQE